jgi:hypothetical protein
MFNSLKPKMKHYVSEADRFLRAFYRDHPKPTHSQKEEIEKHDKIAEKRDHASSENPDKKLWEEF